MPTRVLFEHAQALFREYNEYAMEICGRNSCSFEGFFLSSPVAWAEDVVAGIEKRVLNETIRLRKVGVFLRSAALYGIAVDGLAFGHRIKLAEQFHRFIPAECLCMMIGRMLFLRLFPVT